MARGRCSYEVDGHAIKRLTSACEAVDRTEEAHKAPAQHGTTITDRFNQPKARPEVAIEPDSAPRAARRFRELGLMPESDDEAHRPPRIGSLRAVG